MPRRPLVAIHAAAGALAFLIILGFEAVTIGVEASGRGASIAAVRTGILYVLPVLIGLLMTAGATGCVMAGARPAGLVAQKQRRMMLVAANGALILGPAAVFLAWKAWAGAFDTTFVVVQAAEMIFGLLNLALLGLSLRDGMRLTGRLA